MATMTAPLTQAGRGNVKKDVNTSTASSSSRANTRTTHPTPSPLSEAAVREIASQLERNMREMIEEQGKQSMPGFIEEMKGAEGDALLEDQLRKKYCATLMAVAKNFRVDAKMTLREMSGGTPIPEDFAENVIVDQKRVWEAYAKSIGSQPIPRPTSNTPIPSTPSYSPHESISTPHSYQHQGLFGPPRSEPTPLIPDNAPGRKIWIPALPSQTPVTPGGISSSRQRTASSTSQSHSQVPSQSHVSSHPHIDDSGSGSAPVTNRRINSSGSMNMALNMNLPLPRHAPIPPSTSASMSIPIKSSSPRHAEFFGGRPVSEEPELMEGSSDEATDTDSDSDGGYPRGMGVSGSGSSNSRIFPSRGRPIHPKNRSMRTNISGPSASSSDLNMNVPLSTSAGAAGQRIWRPSKENLNNATPVPPFVRPAGRVPSAGSGSGVGGGSPGTSPQTDHHSHARNPGEGGRNGHGIPYAHAYGATGPPSSGLNRTHTADSSLGVGTGPGNNSRQHSPLPPFKSFETYAKDTEFRERERERERDSRERESVTANTNTATPASTAIPGTATRNNARERDLHATSNDARLRRDSASDRGSLHRDQIWLPTGASTSSPKPDSPRFQETVPPPSRPLHSIPLPKPMSRQNTPEMQPVQPPPQPPPPPVSNSSAPSPRTVPSSVHTQSSSSPSPQTPYSSFGRSPHQSDSALESDSSPPTHVRSSFGNEAPKLGSSLRNPTERPSQFASLVEETVDEAEDMVIANDISSIKEEPDAESESNVKPNTGNADVQGAYPEVIERQRTPYSAINPLDKIVETSDEASFEDRKHSTEDSEDKLREIKLQELEDLINRKQMEIHEREKAIARKEAEERMQELQRKAKELEEREEALKKREALAEERKKQKMEEEERMKKTTEDNREKHEKKDENDEEERKRQEAEAEAEAQRLREEEELKESKRREALKKEQEEEERMRKMREIQADRERKEQERQKAEQERLNKERQEREQQELKAEAERREVNRQYKLWEDAEAAKLERKRQEEAEKLQEGFRRREEEIKRKKQEMKAQAAQAQQAQASSSSGQTFGSTPQNAYSSNRANSGTSNASNSSARTTWTPGTSSTTSSTARPSSTASGTRSATTDSSTKATPPPKANSNSGWRSAGTSNFQSTPQSSSMPFSAEQQSEWQKRQEEYARKQQEQFRRESTRSALGQDKGAKAVDAATAAAVSDAWERYEDAWARVKDQQLLEYRSFPWPTFTFPKSADDLTPGAVGAFVLSTCHSKDKSKKERLKAQLWRWHPDRFNNNIIPKVGEDEKQRFSDAAGQIVRALTDLKERGEDRLFS